MLPSLRPLIAESMRELALSDHSVRDWQISIRGARTLEWCEANDPDNDRADCPDLDMQIEDLEDRLEKISGVLTEWAAFGMKKPAAFRDRLTKLLAD